MEVIYTGFLATPEQVSQMAIDEDVDVVAMSLLNGAHMTAFPKVAKLIREKGGDDILLVGGGIIPDDDKPRLEKLGITGNYGPGTTLKTIIDHVERIVRERDSKKPGRKQTTRRNNYRFYLSKNLVPGKHSLYSFRHWNCDNLSSCVDEAVPAVIFPSTS